MNQNWQVTAENVIKMLRSVQEKSPDNALRVFFSEKRTTEKYRTFMPQSSNELQKKMLSLVLTPLIKALELLVIEYNPVGTG